MGRKAFALAVAALFLYIASPLIFPVAMGAVLAVLFFPLLERLERRRVGTSSASALLTAGITVLLLLPSALLLFFGAKLALQQLHSLKSAPRADVGWVDSILNQPKVHHLMEWITRWFPVQMQELADSAQDLIQSIGSKLADLLGQLVTHLPAMVMALAVMVLSIYFFMVDGRQLLRVVRRNSVFTSRETERLLDSLGSVCRSVILASLVSGAAQAIFETLACLSTATENAFLIGMLVFLASFIPLIGSAPITLFVAFQQLLEGRTVPGIFLLIAAFVVMGLDNVIRPTFLRGSAHLHPLLAFVAAFGGIQTLGFLGVFLGPIIAALFVATIQVLVHAEDPQNAG